jgi:DNA (cytosine-5)-methyltransferase 1
MKFGSVCSGIEAASVAWHPLGWKAAWLSEIEPFPSAVLAHHYPDVPNLGDMTTLPERILSGEVEAPDLFCGGTPCQAFSVAGLRNSLDDARGNLSLTFVGIANAIDTVRTGAGQQPAIIFWENVPGVLSTKDNAFGCFLAGLAGEDNPLEPTGGKWTNAGYVLGPKRAVAWRLLDAQYFGVAQRRRRVFVVASARDDFDPAAVLFEFDGVRRDIAPSRQAGETVTPTIRAGATNGGPGHGARSGDSKDELIVPVGCEFGPSGGRLTDLNPTLDTRAKDGPIRNQLAGAVMQPTAYTTKLHNTASNQAGKVYEEYATSLDANSPPPAVFAPVTQFCDTAGTLTCNHEAPIAFTQNQRDEVRLMGGDGSLVGALAAETGAKQQCYVAQPIAFHPTQDPISSTDGTTHGLGCGSSGGQASVAVAQAIPIDTMNMTPGHSSGGLGFGQPGDPSFTLTKGHSHAVAQPIGIFQDSEFGVAQYDSAGTLRAGRIPEHQMVMQPIVAMRESGLGYWMEDTVAGTLDANMGMSGHANRPAVMTVPQAMAVRRLTPVECERLQGFPDNYTNIPWRKKPASECPDGPRYKALGNSWAIPCVAWIGKRIQEAL